MLPGTAQGRSSDDAEFRFLEPHPTVYRIEHPLEVPALTVALPSALPASPIGAPDHRVDLTARLVLQLEDHTQLNDLLANRPLAVHRQIQSALWILQAADAWAAAEQAAELARQPGVTVSHPVMRRPRRPLGPYAPTPNDPFFPDQYNLEDRTAAGLPVGPDLNARAAWPVTRGEGVVLAIVDDGVDLGHPEFAGRTLNNIHFNFFSDSAGGLPETADDNHGTAVAGLAAAAADNGRGVASIAPAVELASLRIFHSISGFEALAPTEEGLMDMFQHRSNVVSVQNHSWGKDGLRLDGPGVLERTGISNATAFGRQGLGVVMVRAAGNGRQAGQDANEDGYVNDPRGIAVAATRDDGRAASYSTPGACLLVAAPGGDEVGRALVTTDRQGAAAGFNRTTYTNDLADYIKSPLLIGTSFASPQIAGLAALLLSADPSLHYRDAQQILALSARHVDQADPGINVNGAGLRFSHNLGFGIPDAGQAVALARRWAGRPPAATYRYSSSLQRSISDDTLRVQISGDPGIPQSLGSIPSTPGTGLHPDKPLPARLLVDVGYATNDLTVSLNGRAALIERGPPGSFADNRNTFERKLERVAAAGATFAVVFNNEGDYQRITMGGTDFSPIPSVMIGRAPGLEIRQVLQTLSGSPWAQIQLFPTRYTFAVTQPLICEHVGLHIRTTHGRRSDVRITLLSPSGTHSVLQAINQDGSAGPADWTYWSTQHLLEPATGTWTVDISDELSGVTGVVLGVELILEGVDIIDNDSDGLDDLWEQQHFNSLSQGPRDDPDADGYSNAAEQAIGSDPSQPDTPLAIDLAAWNDSLLRLSWPGVEGATYDVLLGNDPNVPGTVAAQVPGRFPETEWFTPYDQSAPQFFRLKRTD